eukprot:CAMPEP_0203672870 /NCGR_PEP_ID=MMETSP0090-20130426/9628_1 /ASSEMBLY_ACC=CAM_ASM_001088 /TAXON_ID=426623 /ORGANISM="Chaetoceros affinis, Strain CCMP159" /LENGTH=339 /DNA_ID=CAMNT_0050538305 /DNA_START=165 /DNA_END=1184 /DNA_ORIENTATION=+
MKSVIIYISTLCLLSASINTHTLAFSPISSSFTSKSKSTTTTTKVPYTTKLYSTTAPSDVTIEEGLSKTVLIPGDQTQPLRFGQVATISYDVYKPSSSSSSSSSKYTIAKSPSSKPQKIIIGDDGSMILGFQAGLNSMVVGEKSIIHITKENSDLYGYGTEGIPPILGSNEPLEIEIEVLDCEEQGTFGAGGVVGANAGGDVSAVSGMTGSGELGALDPMKPRTPEAIAAAYAARQQQMMLEKKDEKEGLEGLIEKAKEFYFFGFFEGETGEKAPWILRPSITFPIAFAVVGLGFYVTYAVGGISERGAQITDELDDIVLSWNVMRDTLAVVAMSLVQK